MSPAASVVAFGDTLGLPRLIDRLPASVLRAIVRADIRPEQRDPLEALAADRGVPLLVQPRFGSPEYDDFSRAVRSFEPDLILVDSYSMIVRPDVLELPALGCVNLHPALLPAYRGPNPLQWAIINDERETGVTLHYMTPEVDAGDILAQLSVPIPFSDTWVDVKRSLDAASERLLGDQLPAVLDGSPTAVSQDAARASAFPRRRRGDGRIDWSWSALRIYNFIRALVTPLPGAFFEAAGEEVVIDRYATVAEVCRLKFGPASGRRFGDEDRALRPADGAASNDALELTALDRSGKPAGSVRIAGMDWAARTCSLTPDAELLDLGARFAREELGLTAR